jgi:hypothetical protein
LTSIERFTNWHIAFKALLFARLGMLAFAVPHAPAQIYQQPAPFAWSLPQIPTGTVMVSTYNGKITEFNQTGTMLGQLDTTTGSLEGGSIFEFLRYITDCDPQQVMKFDPTGALIGSFGGPYGGQCFQEPSSITLDAAGNVYIGQ